MTQSRFRNIQLIKYQETPKKIDNSPSLNLLLRFQRLLIAQMLNCINKCNTGSDPQDQEMAGVESLLNKYICQICNHVTETMPLAAELAAISGKHFVTIASILKADIINVLLPELIICLILLQVNKYYIL